MRGFAIWALAGFLATFAIVTGFSIGFLVAPFAAVAAGLALRQTAGDAEVSGMVLGVGATLVFIGLLNLDYDPCSEHGAVLGPGETEVSCGGTDPVPWLAIGAALAAISVAFYWTARR